MIDPAASVTSVNQRKPTARLAVERALFARRRERPRDLQAPLLTKVETQLTRRTQSLRTVRPIGGAGSSLGHSTQHVLLEKAAFTRHLRPRGTTIRHPTYTPLLVEPNRLLPLPAGGIKALSPPRRECDSRKTQHFRNFFFCLLLAGFFTPGTGIARIFRSFRA